MLSLKHIIKIGLKRFFAIFNIDARFKKLNNGKNIKIDNFNESKTIKTFLNIGAGNWHHKDWINLDKISEFKENGIIRIVCTDIEFLFNAYKRNDKELFCVVRDYGEKESVTSEEYGSLPIINASIQQRLLWSFARQQASIHHNRAKQPISDVDVDNLFKSVEMEEAFDMCIDRCSLEIQKRRPEEHINWYTEIKLFRFLKKAGFNKVLRSRYSQSITPFMRDIKYFDSGGSRHSLYIEAIKYSDIF